MGYDFTFASARGPTPIGRAWSPTSNGRAPTRSYLVAAVSWGSVDGRVAWMDGVVAADVVSGRHDHLRVFETGASVD